MGTSSATVSIPSLDGLRAISITLVLVSHCGYGHVIPGGLGVTIFFFLSGYLITTLLLQEIAKSGQINIGYFYLRRAFRLFPPLIVTLVIAYSLVAAELIGGGISWAGILAQILYFANYYGLFFDPGNTTAAGTGILWSLAVEEHFYMVYPAVMAIMISVGLSNKRIATVLAAVCVIVLGWRIYLVTQSNFDANRTYYSSDTRIDSIVFGCILALIANPHTKKCRALQPILSPLPVALLASSMLALIFAIAWRDPFFRETYRYSIQGLALMPIFYFSIKCAAQFPFSFLNHPWIAKVGVYSYAMYLIHHVVIHFFERNWPWLADRRPFLVIATFTIAALYAALLDVFVDTYFRRLRKQFRHIRGD